VDLRERRAQQLRHPWEVARFRFFRRLVIEHAPAGASSVIDVGAGDGWFAAQLLPSLGDGATIQCWDAHYSAADLAESLPIGISRTADSPPHAAQVVVALDVLEHVLDDHEFVGQQVRPLVANHGVLVVSVPAHPRLFTSHDTALGHYRRHTTRTLRALLEPHFVITLHGSLFSSLLLPRAASAIIEKVRPPRGTPSVDSEWHHGRLLTSAITAVLTVDAWLGRWCARLRLPLPGLSVWAVCTPRSSA
jgi:hypothetical protein